MNKKNVLAVLTGCMMLTACVGAPGPAENPNEEFLSWKFGMFIHFNVATCNQREWANGHEDPATFAPDQLDCGQWADAAKSAGMNYGVLTVKHTGGWCLWDSQYTESHDITAFKNYKNGKGDIVREFVDAFRARGIKVGLYYCAPGNYSGKNGNVLLDGQENLNGMPPEAKEDPVGFMKNQLTELLTGYGPINLLWIDQYRKMGDRWPEVMQHIKSLQPDCLIVANNSHDPAETDIFSYEYPWMMERNPELALPPEGNPHPGEVCGIFSNSWFWNSKEEASHLKSAEKVVDMIHLCNSRLANYLLNVAPDKTGRLPAYYINRLKEVGDLLGAEPATGEEPVSLESLLNEMVDRAALTQTPSPAYTAHSASSYDRESTVNNPPDGLYVEQDGRDWGKGWFANRDFAQFIREEINDGRKETVMMEDTGPGAIVRWWQPSELKRVRWSPSTGKDIIRIYIDGSPVPVIEARPDELIGGSLLASYPFSFMASNDEIETKWRGRNLYLPIPYAKSCKVTWEGTPFYYQIGYRKYAPGTKVESFSMEQLEDAKETLKRVGEQLTAGSTTISGKTTARTDVVLAPKESITLTLSDPGAITKLLVQLSANDYQQALRSTGISMEFDGQRAAWLPVGALGGVGYSAEKNDTFYIKTDPETGTISSTYVMPFQKAAVITLTNHGEQDVTVKQFELTADDHQWDDRSLYFNAT